MKIFFFRFTIVLILVPCFSYSQDVVFTRDDSLRGTVTAERVWWDLTYYHLDVTVKPEEKFIQGNVTVNYKVLNPSQVLQIDLQPPLTIQKVIQNGEKLSFTKDGRNAFMISLKKEQQKGNTESLIISYSGNPIVARNPPWQGGFQWVTDEKGNPFIATSCQGLGASAWWPCKDHMYDEPDSMLISVTVPKSLTDVSNGRLRKTTDNMDGTKTFEWFVSNPINNYGVNVNIADYVHFSDTLQGEKGKLDLDFYVLSYNLEKAKEQFKQAKLMLRAFEYWFGPYPFYDDGYKLVETPYLGMEHQSSVTYGNGYLNGYRGRDLSGTGWGLKWDFIIIHESGHEWFANNITYKDMADMWIHEGFTNYSETLYTEYHFGKDAANEYNYGTRKGIKNDRPIIGHYNVNKSGSGDMYPKAGNMLHAIRHSIDNDKLFRGILRGLNKNYFHQTVTTQQVENYISEKAAWDYTKVFDQYLRTTQVPVLEYYFENNEVLYRWTNCVKDFNLPLILKNQTATIKITPSEAWQRKTLKKNQKILFEAAVIEKMYYITVSAKNKQQ